MSALSEAERYEMLKGFVGFLAATKPESEDPLTGSFDAGYAKALHLVQVYIDQLDKD